MVLGGYCLWYLLGIKVHALQELALCSSIICSLSLVSLLFFAVISDISVLINDYHLILYLGSSTSLLVLNAFWIFFCCCMFT